MQHYALNHYSGTRDPWLLSYNQVNHQTYQLKTHSGFSARDS